MNEHRESDRPIVLGKSPNKDCGAPQPAEEMEERGLAKGNSRKCNRTRAQNRYILNQVLDRVRQVARRDKKLRFTTLWHHVYNVDRLREAYLGLKRGGAAGVDRITWQAYGEGLDGKLEDLSARLKRGAYRARPVRRTYVPKSDGRQRPIGIPATEDKIVQKATVDVLNAVYEEDFLGFSYGFRPGRSQHNALDALHEAICGRKVNWVLDADIRGFFDAIDHEWLVKFVEHRIADKRVIRHIKKWLHAGVLEDEEWRQAEEGTPQGGSISPLLANIYLHYVFDLWIQQWRKSAKGDVIVVRYADDFVIGFQNRHESERCLVELRERLQKFGLELHSDKTRLIEFGRFAAERREKRGKGKPETFDFLGFTHICGRDRTGKFKVIRQTKAKKMRAKLKEIKAQLRKRLHDPIPETGAWLRMVLTGHYRYYGVPGNGHAMSNFHAAVYRLWTMALRRRSQRAKISLQRKRRLVKAYLPYPRIMHRHPSERLRV